MPVVVSVLPNTSVWFNVPVIGRVLFPGLSVIFGIVEVPIIPALSVESVNVTLPISMVMMDGLGIYAYPFMLGDPSVLVTLILTFVTLKPLSPFKACAPISQWEH